MEYRIPCILLLHCFMPSGFVHGQVLAVFIPVELEDNRNVMLLQHNSKKKRYPGMIPKTLNNPDFMSRFSSEFFQGNVFSLPKLLKHHAYIWVRGQVTRAKCTTANRLSPVSFDVFFFYFPQSTCISAGSADQLLCFGGLL